MKSNPTLLILLFLLVSVLIFTVACGDGNGDGDGADTSDTQAADVGSDSDASDETEDDKPTMSASEIDPDTVSYEKIKVTSKMITSSTPWNNGADVAANAFDGKTTTFFDGIENGWIRVDLGEDTVIGKIAFAPRSGYESRLVGSFYGSRDGKTWYEIYDIKTAPSKKKTVEFDDLLLLGAFRFIKYECTEECANVAEIEIYKATGIPDAALTNIKIDTYKDGSYEILDHNPEDEGMTRLNLTSETSGGDAICDYNPSTVYSAAKGSEVVIKLEKTTTVGAIAYMGGSDLSAMIGGEIYGSIDGKSWTLMHTVTEAPSEVASTIVYYGELAATGKYSFVKFTNPENDVNISELRVYSAPESFSVSLTAMEFATSKDGLVNNIALNWGTTVDADKYEIYRSDAGAEYKLVYTGTGTSWSDQGLALGEYRYMLKLMYKNTVIESEIATATAGKMPEDLNVIDNQTGKTGLKDDGPSGYYYEGKYYTYSVSVSGGKAVVTEKVSENGKSRWQSRTIASSKNDKQLANCKIESVKQVYDEKSGTVIIAAHWELPDGYADGKLFLVAGHPGEDFSVKVYNPLGIQVRDLSVFLDEDTGKGYLFAAANKPGEAANSSMYLFGFSEDFTDIDRVVSILWSGLHKEMPNCVKVDGWYYLFLSQTAGWYPSQGQYISTRDIEGEWSELRNIGNTTTFSSQSCWVAVLGDNDPKGYIMHAYRWIAGSGTSGTMLAPISFSEGIAYYDYYPEILHSYDTGAVIPVTYGRLLSQDCKVTTSLKATKDNPASNITDGDYFSSYVANSASWPMDFTIDLGKVCSVKNIQISWYCCQGSEGYYMYTVEGSKDGKSWTELYDNTNESDTKVSNTYGFNSNMLEGEARYVRVNVKGARLQNNPDYNWYTPTIYEVKIYGDDPDAVDLGNQTLTPVEEDAPTVDGTDATDDDATTEAPADDEGGCGSSMGAAAVIAALVSTLGCAIVKKRK